MIRSSPRRATASGQENSAPPHMANDEKVNILVVDDLPEKLLVFETILEDLGQNVVTARSGREALRHLLEREFAVILLDVNMPDMDGFETAAMIRSRRQTAHTPIIFVTAFSDEMHTAQGYSLGRGRLHPLAGRPGDPPDQGRGLRRPLQEDAAGQAAGRGARRAGAGAGGAGRRRGGDPALGVPRRGEHGAGPLARPASDSARARPPGDPVPRRPLRCSLSNESSDAKHCTDLAWIDPPDAACRQISRESDRRRAPSSEVLRRVLENGVTEFHPRADRSR